MKTSINLVLNNNTIVSLTLYIADFVSDLSTVRGLFVQLTHLLCNKLVVIRSSRWKSDVHITLAAFELLSGLAQLSMDHLGEIRITLLKHCHQNVNLFQGPFTRVISCAIFVALNGAFFVACKLHLQIASVN